MLMEFLLGKVPQIVKSNLQIKKMFLQQRNLSGSEGFVKNEKIRKIVNYKGNEVSGIEWKPLKQCRKKSYLFLDIKTQTAICTKDKRVAFMASHISINEKFVTRKMNHDNAKKREVTNVYYFQINGIKKTLCKKCFCNTLDEKEKFLPLALHHLTSVERRPQSTENTEEQLEEKQYLPSHLNLRIIYDMYCEKAQNPVSRKIYENEFHGMNLSFNA
ncbi:hypothetical protein PR048_018516 [Dryococelus australis]|uniref:Uncharacterized protein n=1 Tax=Dryococelus australis TaxID=614101 RepID=A0ABQ9HCI9_9NEOP|nr:hypothetical protein PR048_018516 [Dryococelus australis]